MKEQQSPGERKSTKERGEKGDNFNRGMKPNLQRHKATKCNLFKRKLCPEKLNEKL